MNLAAIAGPVVGTVNPRVTVQLQFSEPPTTLPDGTRVANYSAPQPMIAQVQPISSGDLRFLDNLNLGGAERAIYLYGNFQSVIRLTQQGGDLVALPNWPVLGALAGTTWLTVGVIEQWPQFAKCGIRLQNGG